MARNEADFSDVVECCRKVCWKGYRRFLEVVDSTVSRLLDSEGQDITCRYVSVGNEGHSLPEAVMTLQDMIAPSVSKELQKRLWISIGFDDLGDDLMYLSDFEVSKHVLQDFFELITKELEISAGDPAGNQSPCDSDDSPASVVAYFSYHFFMGVNMKVAHLRRNCLRRHLRDVQISAEAVEKAAERLGIMSPNSETRNLWNLYKSRVLVCVETMDDSMRVEIDEACLILKGLFLSELTYCGSVSQRLIDLWQYGQNIEFLLGTAHNGGVFDSTNAGVCLETSSKFGDDAFTEEYMQKLRGVRNYLRKAGHRCLTDDEMLDVYALLKWKSEHFLTCLSSRAFEDQWALPATCSVRGLERVLDSCNDSSDGEEKCDQPEKTDSLKVCEEVPCRDSCETLDLRCVMLSDDMSLTAGTHKNESAANFEDCRVRHISTSVDNSHNYHYLKNISNRILHCWLKETLQYVKTSGSDMTSLSGFVLGYLLDCEICPTMSDALD